jgi:sulfonate transport system substrate-binding protein
LRRSTSLSFILLTLVFVVAALIAGCQPDAATQQEKLIRIGYQKFGSVSILKARGTLEKRLNPLGYRVQWVPFPAGPQLLEALNTGSIDIGHTGNTPPIFAQAAGSSLVYIGAGSPKPQTEAILVHKDSPIRRVEELKGKKVALNKGSNVHYFLVKSLEKAGLRYQDIQPVYLPPADARAAFAKHSVDAWVIWDPYYSAAEVDLGAKTLVNADGITSNREYFFATKAFSEKHEAEIDILLDELKKSAAWFAKHRQEAASLLAKQIGMDVKAVDRAIRRSDYGIETFQPAIVSDQQLIADTFYDIGLIPKQIQVKEAIWSKAIQK